MSKDKIADYDGATAGNNTDIGGISTAEGMLPSTVNNAMRELTKQLGAFADGTDGIDVLNLHDDDESASIKIQAPATVTTTTTLTLPDGAGTNGDVLTTNGTGTLSWAAASGGISNVVEDTTPELGGDLATSGNDINFGDNDKATFGDAVGGDLQVFHDGTDSHVVTTNGDLNLQVAGAGTINLGDQFGNTLLKVVDNADVKLYHGSTPSEKLATTASGIDVTGTAVTDGLTVAGNVSVDGGTIKLDGNYPVGSNNVALGDTALDSLTTGSQNVAIGSQALTANSSGDSNIGIGLSALRDNTTASNNTAVGTVALLVNTTGANNVAVGRDALASNTTGTANVALGYRALDANTTADENVAVGHNSLTDNTTGRRNTAVGTSAGANNIDAEQNVFVGYSSGIGNTTGDNNVSVGAQAFFYNTSGSSNVAIGRNALQSNTTAGDNVAVGRNALLSNTTGTQNTAVGTNALDANTTGSYNNALGYGAGGSITTANGNTAMGHTSLANTTTGVNTGFGFEAGYYITAGTSNTALGYQSLKNNTASSNTAVGHQALVSNTTGDRNVAVGQEALRSNTVGDRSIAVGYHALYSQNPASNADMYNVAVGHSALAANTTGQYNTAVGGRALDASTTGELNTAIGNSALGAVTTGSRNTAIGVDAGAAITTGTKNTIIGRYNGNQGGLDIRTSSNYIVLSDGDGNPRGIFDSSGNVGIGTTPDTVLHVQGADPTVTIQDTNDTGDAYVKFKNNSGTQRGFIQTAMTSNVMLFGTGTSEAFRVDSSGRLMSHKTTSSLANPGVEHNFTSDAGFLGVTSTGAVAYFNREDSDGTIIVLRQDNVSEGSITVSGSTVSYIGGHLARWSQLTDNTKDTTIVKGTVMTNLDQMAVWSHDEVLWTAEDELPEGVSVGDVKTAAFTENNEQLNCMAVSSVEGDANVAGVFVNWDTEDDGFNDMNIAMTGDMVIRIASGTTVARGDLLMSAGDGTAKPQGDDIVRSKTIAKVTSTNVSHTYDDGSYLVPCVLMAC